MSAQLSPAAPLWGELFHLPDQPGVQIQLSLRRAVVAAILDGRLDPGTPLPSSRELAEVLSLGRNTVTAAYEHLIEEGYLESESRRGVYVARNARPEQVTQRPAPLDPGDARLDANAPAWHGRVRRSLSQRVTLTKPERWQDYPYPFVYGTYDAELFPTESFRECCSNTLSRVQMPLWAPDFETADVPELIDQIRQRLLPRRGVFARADEILITVGSQHAYYLVAEALLDAGTTLGLEEPGHPHARDSFSMRAPIMVDLPVDHGGLMVDALPSLDYLFVTPSHQSPTTHTLTLERRHQLLDAARRQDTVIIEDDYEADQLYAGSPMPALKSLDSDGRVIYIGSLSKSLSPAIRLGYIVAPAALISELRLLRHAMIRHPSAFLQHAYALFLSLGHHDSHARRVNQEMRHRLDAVARALQKYLPQMKFVLPQGGASIWIEAPPWLDAALLAERARRAGVLIEPGHVFFANPKAPCPYFRLRLPSIKTERIAEGIRALAGVVEVLERGACHSLPIIR